MKIQVFLGFPVALVQACNGPEVALQWVQACNRSKLYSGSELLHLGLYVIIIKCSTMQAPASTSRVLENLYVHSFFGYFLDFVVFFGCVEKY